MLVPPMNSAVCLTSYDRSEFTKEYDEKCVSHSLAEAVCVNSYSGNKAAWEIQKQHKAFMMRRECPRRSSFVPLCPPHLISFASLLPLEMRV